MPTPKIISLYSGAGGLDYGFEAAGYETCAFVEFDHDACESLRLSRPRLAQRVIERSIFDVPTSEILERGGLAAREPDLVIGGPPCQPFSKSGYWARGDALRLLDPRSDTLAAYMRVVEEALPRAFVLENVQGLNFSEKDEGLQLVLRLTREINKRTGSSYRPHFRVLNAASFGVPQLRERFFLVAARDGSDFRFPVPTHGEPQEGSLFEGLAPYRTAWDALGDEQPDPADDLRPRGKWAALLPSIPEGSNYLFHTERGTAQGGVPLFGWRRRYWNFLLKLAKSKPSWTLQAQPGPAVGPFHWSSRRLSILELRKLQTFPSDARIYGERTSAQRQVGNAVASLVAEVLGRAIRVQLLGLKEPRGGLRLLPKDRSATLPPPEALRAVPAPYMRLKGSHTAHPGTGQGYGARRRSARPFTPSSGSGTR